MDIQKTNELQCRIFPLNTLASYKYVVVCTWYQGKWVLSRHKERDTWENPGGHIEPGETPMEAARRELKEETGIEKAEIHPVCDYVGSRGVRSANGMIFLAMAEELGELPDSEMAEARAFNPLPSNLTYPVASPVQMWEAEAYRKRIEMGKRTF